MCQRGRVNANKLPSRVLVLGLTTTFRYNWDNWLQPQTRKLKCPNKRRPLRAGFVIFALLLHLCHGPTLTEASSNKQNKLKTEEWKRSSQHKKCLSGRKSEVSPPLNKQLQLKSEFLGKWGNEEGAKCAFFVCVSKCVCARGHACVCKKEETTVLRLHNSVLALWNKKNRKNISRFVFMCHELHFFNSYFT